MGELGWANNIFLSSAWGNSFSFLGLLASLIGFWFTIRNVVKSKDAAEQAKEAVQGVRLNLRKGETVADLGAAIAIMEEIKRIHRSKSHNPESLVDRYGELKKSLINIREGNPVLTDEDKSKIQDAVTQIASLERMIDDRLGIGEDLVSSFVNPRNNRLVTKHLDEMLVILLRLKGEAEGFHGK